jgi:hypothetical protein
MRRAANGSDERRQLTAVFCDLIGSTELSANRDPEVVRAYHELAAGLVVRHGGHVAHYRATAVTWLTTWAMGWSLTSPTPRRTTHRPDPRARAPSASRTTRARPSRAPAPVVLRRCQRRGRKLAPHSRAL